MGQNGKGRKICTKKYSYVNLSWSGLPVVYLPCPHKHLKTPVVDRKSIDREQHMNLLATPKGYTWDSPKDGCNKQICKPMCNNKKKNGSNDCSSPETFQGSNNTMDDIWKCMTPDLCEKLMNIFVNDFNLSKTDAKQFIDEQKGNYKGKMSVCKCPCATGDADGNIWMKEFSELIGCKLKNQIALVLCGWRTKRQRAIMELIINAINEICCECINISCPETRLHRVLVVAADRLAVWLDRMYDNASKEVADEESAAKRLDEDKERREREEAEEKARREAEEKARLEAERARQQQEEEAAAKLMEDGIAEDEAMDDEQERARQEAEAARIAAERAVDAEEAEARRLAEQEVKQSDEVETKQLEEEKELQYSQQMVDQQALEEAKVLQESQRVEEEPLAVEEEPVAVEEEPVAVEEAEALPSVPESEVVQEDMEDAKLLPVEEELPFVHEEEQVIEEFIEEAEEMALKKEKTVDPMSVIVEWIEETQYAKTDRQKEIGKIVKTRLSSRLQEYGDVEGLGEAIDSLNNKVSTWIDKLASEAEKEIKPLISLARRFQAPKGVLYHIKKGNDNYYNVKQVSCDDLAEHKRKINRAMTSDDIKDFTKWAEGLINVSDAWTKWVENAFCEAYTMYSRNSNEPSELTVKEFQAWRERKRKEAIDWKRAQKSIYNNAQRWEEWARFTKNEIEDNYLCGGNIGYKDE